MLYFINDMFNICFRISGRMKKYALVNSFIYMSLENVNLCLTKDFRNHIQGCTKEFSYTKMSLSNSRWKCVLNSSVLYKI